MARYLRPLIGSRTFNERLNQPKTYEESFEATASQHPLAGRINLHRVFASTASESAEPTYQVLNTGRALARFLLCLIGTRYITAAVEAYQHARYNSALCSTLELVRLTQTESSVLQPVQQNRKCDDVLVCICLLYTSPSPRDKRQSRMPSSA